MTSRSSSRWKNSCRETTSTATWKRSSTFRYVRDWAQELAVECGRPSIDPVIFFQLQLIMFFEGIRSERTLIETASLNLAHRWYLGYALDEALPDHSSLTRIRQRLGIGIFERFFEQVVDLCQEAGLVWGRELYRLLKTDSRDAELRCTPRHEVHAPWLPSAMAARARSGCAVEC